MAIIFSLSDHHITALSFFFEAWRQSREAELRTDQHMRQTFHSLLFFSKHSVNLHDDTEKDEAADNETWSRKRFISPSAQHREQPYHFFSSSKHSLDLTTISRRRHSREQISTGTSPFILFSSFFLSEHSVKIPHEAGVLQNKGGGIVYTHNCHY